MPQHRSAWKRVRTSAKQRERNRIVRSRVRTAIRQFAEAELDQKPEMLRLLTSELDNAVRKGVIKDTTASRRKSRTAKLLTKLQAEATAKSD